MTSASISSEPAPKVDVQTPPETGLPERQPPNLAEKGWLHGRSPANQQIIIMHQDEHAHALKEVDAAALAVTKTPEQVVAILSYVIEGKLAGYTDQAQAAE